MGITASQLVAEVKVIGDTEADSKLNRVSGTVDKVGGHFKDMLGNALSFAAGQAVFTGVGDAVGFLKDKLTDAFHESMDAQAGMALTNAVLKSTHDASGMSAQSIADLAGQMSHLTKFSDDTTQAAENMLLTFTNIGKNVFPQATKTVLDMSQALGQDTKSSAIQLGKALNDPITGVSALQRVGVTFNQTQKDLIATYIKHGDTAKAQGVILKELQKEFGGAAVAAGKTFGGQLVIAHQYLADIEQNIGDALMPLLTGFLGTVEKDGLPILQKFSDWFEKDGVPDIQNMAGEIGPLIGDIETFGANIATTAEKSGAFQAVLKMVDDILPNVKQDIGHVGGAVEQLLPPTLDLIKNFSAMIDNSGWLRDALSTLGGAIQTVSSILSPLIQDLSNVFNWLSQNKPATDALESAVVILGGAFLALKIGNTVAGFAQMFTKVTEGKGIIEGLSDAFGNKLGGAINDFLNIHAPKLKTALGDIGGEAKGAASEVTGLGTAAETTAGKEDLMGDSAFTADGKIAGMGKSAATSEVELAGAEGAGGGGLALAIGTVGGAAALLALPFFLASPSTKAAFVPAQKDQYQAPPGFWDFITHQGAITNQNSDLSQIMSRPLKDSQTFADNIDKAWNDMESLFGDAEKRGQLLGDLSDPRKMDAADVKIQQIKEHLDDLGKPVIIKPLTPEVVAARLKIIDLKSHLDDLSKPVTLNVGTPHITDADNKVIQLKEHLDDLAGNYNIGVNYNISGPSPFHGHASGILNNPVGHWAMVGEKGPEPMYVPQGASIFPNSSIPSLLGQSLTNNQPQIIVQVHPNDVVLDGHVLTRAQMPYITDAIRYAVNSRVA